jgi:hypothetical protein
MLRSVGKLKSRQGNSGKRPSQPARLAMPQMSPKVLTEACRQPDIHGMRALSKRRFIRDFSKVKNEPLTVTDRGHVIGTWIPMSGKPKPINYYKRLKDYCSEPLPFTFAQLLREGKKR